MPNTFDITGLRLEDAGWSKHGEANGRVGKLGSAKFLGEWVGVRACNFFADPTKQILATPLFAWDMPKLVALTHGLKQDTSTRVDKNDSSVDYFSFLKKHNIWLK